MVPKSSKMWQIFLMFATLVVFVIILAVGTEARGDGDISSFNTSKNSGELYKTQSFDSSVDVTLKPKIKLAKPPSDISSTGSKYWIIKSLVMDSGWGIENATTTWQLGINHNGRANFGPVRQLKKPWRTDWYAGCYASWNGDGWSGRWCNIGHGTSWSMYTSNNSFCLRNGGVHACFRIARNGRFTESHNSWALRFYKSGERICLYSRWNRVSQCVNYTINWGVNPEYY